MYTYPQLGRIRTAAPRLPAGPWQRPTGLPTAVALLEDGLSREVALGTQDAFRSVRATSVAEAAAVVRDTAARALLVSPAFVARESPKMIRLLLDRCPGVRSIGILTPSQTDEPAHLVALGSLGVDAVVDLGISTEFNRLRDLVASYDPVITGRILEAVLDTLSGTPPQVQRFFGVMVQASPDLSTVRELSGLLEVTTSTLISRFYRAGLPSPKGYLVHVRLSHAAGYFENKRHSIADVAYRLRYSSPQSFGRSVRTALGITAGQFRESMSFDVAIEHLIGTMLLPHLSQLKKVRPLSE